MYQPGFTREAEPTGYKHRHTHTHPFYFTDFTPVILEICNAESMGQTDRLEAQLGVEVAVLNLKCVG